MGHPICPVCGWQFYIDCRVAIRVKEHMVDFHPENQFLYNDVSHEIKLLPKPARASHDSTGKLPMDLIPPEAMSGLARVLKYGAAKYGRRNWEKGMPLSEFYGSTLRHLNSWMNGEEFDPESEIHHMWHAMANIAMLGTLMHRNPDLDDRPLLSSDAGRPTRGTLEAAYEQGRAAGMAQRAQRAQPDRPDGLREQGGATGVAHWPGAPGDGPERGAEMIPPVFADAILDIPEFLRNVPNDLGVDWSKPNEAPKGHHYWTCAYEGCTAFTKYDKYGFYCSLHEETDPPISDIAAIQKRVREWADKQFGANRKPYDALRKLVMEEVPELMRSPKSAEEYADCVILILDYADLNDIDVYKAVMAKMAINEAAEWIVDESTGLRKRVK